MKNKIKHPVGNSRIFLIKLFEGFISKVIFFFLTFIIKINKAESEIIISNAFFAPWKVDRLFFNFFIKVKKYTLLDVKRAYTLWYLSSSLKNIKGAILDVGCLQGGAGFLMSKANKKGNTFLIDSFEGIVELAEEKEKFYNKDHFVFKDIDQVKKNIKKLNLKNTKVVKSYFPKKFNKNIKKIKICHIDVNTFQSTKKSFLYVHKKLVKNGIIIFDDYGVYGNNNIKRFINTISKNYNKHYQFIYNFFGQCILIRKNY